MFTGFSVSTYTFENSEYNIHLFSDEDGFLGDERLLWLPVNEALEYEDISYNDIPQDYIDSFRRINENKSSN
jgi:hypothetical protein